mmetsp:Transcript_56336/g.106148  ORF Transcript_56336/g.106148 Transcript_56336/m.106148 type:complete len:108 (+) Transcript_56336:788-1111(+)
MLRPLLDKLLCGRCFFFFGHAHTHEETTCRTRHNQHSPNWNFQSSPLTPVSDPNVQGCSSTPIKQLKENGGSLRIIDMGRFVIFRFEGGPVGKRLRVSRSTTTFGDR